MFIDVTIDVPIIGVREFSINVNMISRVENPERVPEHKRAVIYLMSGSGELPLQTTHTHHDVMEMIRRVSK